MLSKRMIEERKPVNIRTLDSIIHRAAMHWRLTTQKEESDHYSAVFIYLMTLCYDLKHLFFWPYRRNDDKKSACSLSSVWWNILLFEAEGWRRVSVPWPGLVEACSWRLKKAGWNIFLAWSGILSDGGKWCRSILNAICRWRGNNGMPGVKHRRRQLKQAIRLSAAEISVAVKLIIEENSEKRSRRKTEKWLR
jgi:hypothetical protein